MSSGACAQRRNVDHVERKSVEEIRAEAPDLREPRQVLVGRADDPHVGRDRLRSADALELAVLDRAQDLFLHAERNRAELVEHERAAVRLLEAADVRTRRSGERAGLVAEELGLEQRLGERRAVDLDDRLLPARRQIVKARRDQLLAGAPLADHEHGLRELRGSGDVLEHRQERRRLADQRGRRGSDRGCRCGCQRRQELTICAKS